MGEFSKVFKVCHGHSRREGDPDPNSGFPFILYVYDEVRERVGNYYSVSFSDHFRLRSKCLNGSSETFRSVRGVYFYCP